MIRNRIFNALRLLITMSICGLMVCIPNTYSESGVSREYSMKAAFIYKFTKFIEWSQDSFSDEQDPFILTIVGSDPFGAAIEPLSRKSIRGRKIHIKRAKEIEDIDKSQILFISQSEKKRMPEVLQSAKKLSALTISDTEGFTDHGGVINFFMANNTIGFEINVNAAQEAGLNISSNLLTLAKIVDSGSNRGKN